MYLAGIIIQNEIVRGIPTIVIEEKEGEKVIESSMRTVTNEFTLIVRKRFSQVDNK